MGNVNKKQDEQTERERWAKTFEYCMQQLSGVYGREFGHPAMKAYQDACEGWSVDKMREVFRRAMEAERFCPTVAALKAYGAGIRDEMAPPVVEPYEAPKYTPEEAEDIRRMIADLSGKGLAMPWAKPLPDGFNG